MTEKEQIIGIDQVLTRVNTRINRCEEDISDDLSTLSKVSVTKRAFFICSNPFWDIWFQKLFALFISVKIWIITLITVLLVCGLITNAQFAAMLGILIAAKGGFDIADVWRRKGSSTIIDQV